AFGARGKRRVGRARLVGARRGACADGGRPRPTRRGTGARGVEESCMTEPTSSTFLAPQIKAEEEELERSLRPQSLGDFVGQERVKEQLSIALEAAKNRGEA